MDEIELDNSITDAMVDAAFYAWMRDTKNDKLAMRRAIRAALSLPVSNTGEWQPISTAPRDGTSIWVATIFSGHGTGCMEPVRTHYHHYGEWTNIYTGNSINWKPTHWQPLPEAPL